jgi:ABC-type transport system involved in multi-copper enzyme maturation permease subunit
MFQFALSGFRSGMRGRSFQAVFALGLVLVGVAYLSGYFSPRQPRTVALDVGLSGLRFSLVLLNLFWMQELIAKEIDRRTILFSLAYPVPRSAFLLGRFISMLCLSTVAALTMALALWLAVLVAGGGYEQEFAVALGLPYWATVFGLVVDAAVVGAFALWMSTLSTVAVLPFILGAAFALGGKALGPVLDYLQRGADGDVDLELRYRPVVEAIQWILPDLSRLDWRHWPMYGQDPGAATIGWSLLLAASYAAVILLLAIAGFRRREFS